VSWLQLDVRSASLAAVALVLFAVAARPWGRRWTGWLAAAAFETAVVCALFALWQAANSLTHGHEQGGLSHGRDVWALERAMHLPSEAAAQQLILGHHTVVRAVNYYYATAHLTGMLVFLVWLWLRHRDRYAQWRTIVALFTALSLLVEIVPVAPPRLIGNTGLVDTALVYGQSVYAFVGSNLADQYAALPSIHVGWAALIAVAVVRCGRGWGRWAVAIGHGLGTFLVVVVTANHYWLDGVSAVAVLAAAWLAERGLRRVTGRWRVPVAAQPQIPQPQIPQPQIPQPQIQQGAVS
jgi:PAP2 superfamily